MLEEWNKKNPKIGYEASKVRLRKVGYYGNYTLRDKLMELIAFLKNQYNVVVIKKDDQKYFKGLEYEILQKAQEMIMLL